MAMVNTFDKYKSLIYGLLGIDNPKVIKQLSGCIYKRILYDLNMYVEETWRSAL